MVPMPRCVSPRVYHPRRLLRLLVPLVVLPLMVWVMVLLVVLLPVMVPVLLVLPFPRTGIVRRPVVLPVLPLGSARVSCVAWPGSVPGLRHGGAVPVRCPVLWIMQKTLQIVLLKRKTTIEPAPLRFLVPLVRLRSRQLRRALPVAPLPMVPVPVMPVMPRVAV